MADKQDPAPRPLSKEAASRMQRNQEIETHQPVISCDKVSSPLRVSCPTPVILYPDGSMAMGVLNSVDWVHGEKVIQPGIVHVSCPDETGHKCIPMVQPGYEPVSGPHVIGLGYTLEDGRRHRKLKVSPKPHGIGHQDNLMGQQSNGPVHVLGSQYTSEGSVILVFKKSAAGGYSVPSAAESGVPWKFLTSPCDTNLHRRIELVELGEERTRVAMLVAKNITTHGRWKVYRCSGESIADREKVCSIRRGGDGTDILVALKNSSSDTCDFKFTGNLLDRNCTIFTGDSSTIIAQMRPMENDDEFMVEVYPNVDCAFVVSLIAVVAVINSPGKVRALSRHALKVAGGAAVVGGQVLVGSLM